MSKIGNLEGIENPEISKSSKSLDIPSIPTENDRKKLNISQLVGSSEGKKPSEIKNMSDREKIAYYRKNGMNSLADNRNAIMRGNEGNGENQRLTKLNSHNYDKLAQVRGLDSESAKGTKESFAKWSPEAKPGAENLDKSLRNHSVLIRHAPEGEKANITGNKPGDGREPSGVFVAKGFPQNADKRQEDYALPPSNKAETVRRVELARPQNIMVGQVGPQKQFETGEDDIHRTGGGRQIVTDGGFGGRDVNGDGIKEPALRYVGSDETRSSPMQNLSSYMNAHNYGKNDFAKYSQDPEWQKLHEIAFPNWKDRPSDAGGDVISHQEMLDHFGLGNHRNSSDYFVKGDHYDQFEDDYYNPETKITRYDNPQEREIAPSLIEGIHLGKREVENPSVFWGHHKNGGTAESFQEIASHIPEVKARLMSGDTLDALENDDRLSDCASIYFRNKPEVIEKDGYYIFSGNGRHRILAARALGHDIPVKILGKQS